ncbi:MAG: CaiB/BaiF CoA transferase family protein [Candidatus Binatia bacterium]
MTEPALFLPPYRVLDLAGETGTFGGKLLADLGLEVIKVEPPIGGPDRRRPPFFHDQETLDTSLDFLACNTNKRSLALDIGHPQGRACFRDLVRRADVLIETFPPGYLEDRGLGYAALRELNPRLVMASITPYGQTGPRRHYRSSDLIAMATSGFMQVTGDPDGPPMRLGNNQSRFAPALYAAVGVVAALLHRDWHTGAGQHIDVSTQEALLSFYLEQHPVLCWQVRRKNVTRVGPVSSLAVPAGVFPCRDGWIGIGIFTAREWKVLSRWFYDVTGHEEILAPELCGGIHARAAHRDLIEAVLLDFTMRQTRAQLVRDGQQRSLVVVPVNTVADLLADQALAQAEFWKDLDHPVVGRLRYPINLLGSEVHTAGRAAPRLGEANEEILCGELGMTRRQLEELAALGVVAPLAEGAARGAKTVENPPATAGSRPTPVVAPAGGCAGAAPSVRTAAARNADPQPPAGRVLDGVRVVEFGPFIALPLTGRILAALGANVIKVESNKLPDELIFVPPWGKGMGQPEYQALKERITLDVHTPEGAALMKRLIGTSDVFMTNFRRDALARWGMDLDELRRNDPRLIIVHQAGFGSGPYETYKLYGIMAQHVCGVSMISGKPGDPPCCLNSAYSDYHTPLLQVLAVLGALARRRRSGQGMLIEGSIFRSGVCTVATALLECQVSGHTSNRLGNHDPLAVPHNAYPCQGEDAWCAVAVEDGTQWRALCRVLGHPKWALDERFATAAARRAHEEELDALVAGVTRRWNKHDLMEQLQGAGVPAGIVATGEDLANDPQLRSRAVYTETTYYVPDAHRSGIEWQRGPDVPAARLPLLFSDTPCATGPYHRIGENNDDVYHGLLGLPPEEIRRLTECGVLL